MIRSRQGRAWGVFFRDDQYKGEVRGDGAGWWDCFKLVFLVQNWRFCQIWSIFEKVFGLFFVGGEQRIGLSQFYRQFGLREGRVYFRCGEYRRVGLMFLRGLCSSGLRFVGGVRQFWQREVQVESVRRSFQEFLFRFQSLFFEQLIKREKFVIILVLLISVNY